MTSKLSVLKLAVLFSIWSTTAFTRDTFILVCNLIPPSITRVSLTSSTIEHLPIKNIGKPAAIDYDDVKKMIYWTDVGLKQIRATHAQKDDENDVILSLSNDSMPEGLAVDTHYQRVFYTDAGRNVIGAVDMDGSNHKDLITNGLDHPRAIVLDQKKRKFYFTDLGESPYIAFANYDGSKRQQIYSRNLITPTGLALDKTSQMLLWCDGHTEKIETGSVSGNDRHVLLPNSSHRFFDIFLFDNILYFTVQTEQGVWSMPEAGGHLGRITSGQITRFGGLHVYSTSSKCGGLIKCPVCGHCLTNSSCEPRHGVCLAGCNSGYTGLSCMEKCPRGSFGAKCAQKENHLRPAASGGILSVFRQRLQSLLALFFFGYVCVQTALRD